MSKWFLNWYRKQLLLSVLKNRSKNNDVGLYFSDRGFIIVKMEKKSNICFAADLPEFDREYFENVYRRRSILLSMAAKCK